MPGARMAGWRGLLGWVAMEINVTRPFLPPIDDYQRYVREIWQRAWITNNGPLVNELERRLKSYLDLEGLLFVVNGTVALQLAIKALDLSGEVITTPFSYVATTTSLLWEHCEPVMVDICPDTLNIDPSKIEAAIGPRTSAILATHVYGNACAIEALEAIAARHNLKLVFDGAHAFGSRYRGKSLFAYGDVATASFHATKLFHTGEGGMVCAQRPEVLRRLALMRNFGHVGTSEFDGIGINGKASELHAAMGLCVLPYVEEILQVRRTLCAAYDLMLEGLPLRRPAITPGCDYNHAYYPVIFETEATLERIVAVLGANQVIPRRYFHPSLSQLPYLKRRSATGISDDVSRRILCLPLYHTLGQEEIGLICRLIRAALRPG
jgi:dTDP-4-amino-4,6-dideoxygalactose transaminase